MSQQQQQHDQQGQSHAQRRRNARNTQASAAAAPSSSSTSNANTTDASLTDEGFFVRVKMEDGTIEAVPAESLVMNKAYAYLLQHPGRVASACKHGAKCTNVLTCTFVHIKDSSVVHREVATLKVILGTDVVGPTTVHRDDFVQNPAFWFLLQHPNRAGKLCMGHNNGITDATCWFVHLKPQSRYFDDANAAIAAAQRNTPGGGCGSASSSASAAAAAASSSSSSQQQMQPASNRCIICLDDVYELAQFHKEEQEKLAGGVSAGGAASSSSTSRNGGRQRGRGNGGMSRNNSTNSNNGGGGGGGDATASGTGMMNATSSSSSSGSGSFSASSNTGVLGANGASLSSTASPAFFRCKRGHSCCSVCLSTYVVDTWTKKQIEPGRIPTLRCLAPGCDDLSPIRPGDLARIIDPAAFDSFLEVFQRAVESRALSDVSTRLTDILQMDAAHARVASLELEQMTLNRALGRSVYQCPECSYGPVIHGNCSNLATHEGQRDRGSDTRVSNKCPQCGFFGTSIDEWDRWDGIVRRQGVSGPVAVAAATAAAASRREDNNDDSGERQQQHRRPNNRNNNNRR